MTIIIVGFHILLLIGIVLMIQAIAEKKRLKKLEESKTQETGSQTSSSSQTKLEAKPVQSEPVSEQKQAVQMVHHGLVNVVRHLTAIEGHRPEMALAEISASAATASTANGAKHCPNCNAPWDNAFDFCLKCSQTENN